MILDLVSSGALFHTVAPTYAVIALGLDMQWGQTGLFDVGGAGSIAPAAGDARCARRSSGRRA